MDRIDRVIEVFASELGIRNYAKQSVEAADKTAQLIFRAKLKEDLDTREKEMRLGDIVEYEHRLAKRVGANDRHIKVCVESTNSALMKIFDQLPALDSGLSYILPNPSKISFKLEGEDEETAKFTIYGMSRWVEKWVNV
ncbi:MAG: hypothetical protein HFJ55_03100 [Clostridia bacterium]|nr:hypothetical protein [Clostridia bacterium]